MKKLNDLISRIGTLEKDAAAIDKLENKARADIADIVRSNLSMDVQKQKISDARLTLDLVEARREKVTQPLMTAREELHAEYFRCIGIWNAAVQDDKKARVSHFLNVTAPLLGGDMSDCRAFFPDWKIEQMPIAHTYRQAIQDTLGLEHIFRRDPIQTVQGFIKHVEKYAPLLRLNSVNWE